LRKEEADLRSHIYPPIPVCPTLGYRGIPGLRHATSQLQRVRGNHPTSPLGLWQKPAHVLVPIVPGNLGQAFDLEGESICFSTSWDSVYRAVQWVVHWGIANRELTGIESIGIDEIQHRRGHHYLTLVYQLDQGYKRPLCVRQERTEASLSSFFSLLDAETIKGIKYVCTDMWPPYLKVLRERATGTMNILDRSHIMKKFSEALDRVRADETRQLRRDGYEPLLTKSRWCILKKRENLTEAQTVRLNELLKYNLKTTKA